MLSSCPQCNNCSQNTCFVSQFCSSEWKDFLDKNKVFGTYKNKQPVFYEGNIVFGVFFIYSGKIKIFNTGKNNRQHVIRLATSGEILGLRGFAEKTYLVSGTALEDSSLCFFEKEVFVKTLRKNPEFAISLIQFYAQEMANIEIRHRNSMQLNIIDRIAEALLMLKTKYGVPILEDGKETTLIDVFLSRQDIADIAGAAPEDISRALSAFKKEHILRIESNQKIVLTDAEKLNEMYVR